MTDQQSQPVRTAGAARRRKARSALVSLVTLGLALGMVCGLGFYTFVYARGSSYLTNDPAACANCHIMGDHYAAWVKGSHRTAAACNDCHTPPGLIPKYMTKASNGFWHSFAFTTGRFPDPIRIKPHNRTVTEKACRKCHTAITMAIDPHANLAEEPDQALSCIRCHADVGHIE